MKEAPVAGFDISKSSSDICVLAPGNEVVWRSKMAHTSQSMAQVARRLGQHRLLAALSAVVPLGR